VVRMASPLNKLRISAAQLDPHPMFLSCVNGTIDLDRAALLDHDPEHLITGATEIIYNPDAPCPTWDRFMSEICDGDIDLVAYLQRAVGYSLTARVEEQCLFFLYGNGANGKSTFLAVLQRMLGDYATTCSADLILTKRHEQHPTAIAQLFGKRLAIVGEVDDGRSWDEATVKNLTGSDVITARRMREDAWTFEPRHKLWIAGNYRPGVRGVDNGIWRRMRLIPFTASFRGREDRDLMRKLTLELPGILAWAVRGAQQWARHGLETPARVQAETDEYRAEQDFFRAFMEETFEITQHEEDRAARSQIVQLYEQWRIRNGAPVLTARGISERIRAHGVGEAKTNGITYWTRIKMRPRYTVTLGGAAAQPS
jgi:putative DNA primase/helicase